MLRAYLYLSLFIPLTVLMSSAALISTFFDATGITYHRIACTWSSICLRMAGVTVKVSGLENIPEGTPVIFMSNHQSSFDIPALYKAIPVRFSWIAKEALFSYPIFGQSMRRAGYIPLNRKSGRKSLASLIAAAGKIKNGTSVLIFPEGTRSEDTRLIPFKKGGFLLAEKAGVPVIPVAISGSGRINPANRIWIKPGEIRIKFAEAVVSNSKTSLSSSELMDLVRCKIEANLEG